jgi:hypothetical protein
VLVWHSYGGAVITEAGTHDKVMALVYIAACAPDKGESVRTFYGDPNAPGSPLVSAPGGFLFQDRLGCTLGSVLTCAPQTPRSWPTRSRAWVTTCRAVWPCNRKPSPSLRSRATD